MKRYSILLVLILLACSSGKKGPQDAMEAVPGTDVQAVDVIRDQGTGAELLYDGTGAQDIRNMDTNVAHDGFETRDILSDDSGTDVQAVDVIRDRGPSAELLYDGTGAQDIRDMDTNVAHDGFETRDILSDDSGAADTKIDPGAAIPRPDPSLFDCTADWSTVPARRSKVPLDCYTDPACHTPMVIGHRAAGGQLSVIAPENTLAAVRAAILMGVDGIEIDVRDTKDGHLVLMHDDTVDRTTDGHGKVSDLTLAQIRALHIKVNKGIEGDFSCLKVPTFKEVLDMAKGRLFIDVDTKTSRVDLVVKAVEEAGMLDYATISSGSMGKLKQARELAPKCSIQVRPDTMNALQQALDEFDPDPQVIEVPATLVKQASAVVRPLGLKLYTDMFPTDAIAYMKGDFSGYLKIYNDGCDIEASEFPSAVLKALGRWEVTQ